MWALEQGGNLDCRGCELVMLKHTPLPIHSLTTTTKALKVHQKKEKCVNRELNPDLYLGRVES